MEYTNRIGREKGGYVCILSNYIKYSVSQKQMVHVEMHHFNQQLFYIFHSILYNLQDY